MNEERENEIIKEFNEFKYKHSSIHKANEYNEEYDFYNKNALFYIMAEYMEGEELTQEEMNETHPIHYEYNFFGNSTFKKWRKKYLLDFEWYNSCIGVLTKADITEFNEELTEQFKAIDNNEVNELIKNEEEEYKEHCFNELVKCINEEYLKIENNKSKMFSVPIEKIENVKCSLYVELFKSHYFMRVSVDNLNDGQSFYMDYHIKDIFDKQDLKNILKKIENLKYDNLNGLLYDKTEKKLMSECFNTLLKKIENVKTCYEECTICYKQTRTKTPCKHFLCTECVQSMNEEAEKEREDNEGIELKCPVCRYAFYEIRS